LSIRVGFHVSISGGISNSVDIALKIGCSAFQIFTRNPRGWAAKPLQEEDVINFRKKLANSNIDRNSVVVHMPYLPNLCSPNNELYKKSTSTLIEELQRSSALGIPYIVLHLGKYGGTDKNMGINQLIEACNFAFENYYKSPLPPISSSFPTGLTEKKKKDNSNNDKDTVTILLENSAGEKNSIGSKFDELGLILDKLRSSTLPSSNSHRINNSSFGICLDTCHAFVAGYDLGTKNGVYETLDKFNKEVGLKNLKLIHLNDSKDKLNSNHDRHEHIGLGKIGKEGFRTLLNHKSVKKLPIIMETPIDSKRDDSDNLKVVLDLSTLVQQDDL
jgi:deoxyribonuclease IV